MNIIFKRLCAAALMLCATAVLAENDVKFPELKSSHFKNGDFIGPDNVARVRAGMNKDQVASQLGNPHFSEGLMSHNWNYVFNFYTGAGTEYVTCQFQVQYGKNRLVSQTRWRDQQCEAYIKEKPPVVIEAPVNQTHPLTLSADGMFAFGRSNLVDLQPLAHENLSALATQVKAGYKTLRSIDVVGYSDRLGTEASNIKLSAERANSVKMYLVSLGLPADLIRTQGAGSSNPKVACPGAKTPKVIACLMPNRRIEVRVNGDL